MRSLLIAMCSLIISQLSAVIINIPVDQPTIQAGIDVSADGDTVLVQPGTYIELINFSGKEIIVASHYFTTLDTAFISQTIIDGDGNERVIRFENEETENSKLIGFTVKNGYGNYYGTFDVCGTGIYVLNSSPCIEHNIIEDNNSFWYVNGCGIGLHNSSATIRQNIIRNNIGAYNGGGIYIYQSDGVVIENNIIYGHQNQSGNGIDCGAGICLMEATNILIKNNLIYNNNIDFRGGGIGVLANSSVVLENNTITENFTSIASGSGAAIYCSTSEIEVINSIIWNNNSNTAIQIYGENITAHYCDIQNNFEGAGNINNAPMFANSSACDFSLTLQSPCINTGDPNSPFDPDGTISDMGYQYFDMSNFGSITGTISLSGGFGNIENAVKL